MNDSSIARVVGVLFSPTKTFEAIRQRPTWLVALVILVILGVIGSYLVTGKMDMEDVVRDAIADRGSQASEEQIEQAIEFQEKFGSILAILGVVVVFPVGCLLMALLFWLILKLLGGEFPYQTSFATSLHGLMPTAVSSVLSLPVILSRDELAYDDVRTGSILKSNLGAFAGEETGVALRTLLSSIDLFSIWCAILLVIGYSVVGKVSRGKAAGTVIGLWVLWIAIKVGWAALFG